MLTTLRACAAFRRRRFVPEKFPGQRGGGHSRVSSHPADIIYARIFKWPLSVYSISEFVLMKEYAIVSSCLHNFISDLIFFKPGSFKLLSKFSPNSLSNLKLIIYITE